MERDQPSIDGPESAHAPSIEHTPPGVRPLYASEDIAVQAFKDAITKALDSADGACGTVLTASFSIVTAYGAAVALIAPKDTPRTILVLTPFIAISLAIMGALLGKAAGVKMSGEWNDVGENRSTIQRAVRAKRAASAVAVAFLAVGMVVAGWILSQHFSGGDNASGQRVIGLTVSGKRILGRACSVDADHLRGTVNIQGDFTTVTLTDPKMCSGTSTVTLPSSAVAFVRGR
jgi:hypothetical protein